MLGQGVLCFLLPKKNQKTLHTKKKKRTSPLVPRLAHVGHIDAGDYSSAGVGALTGPWDLVAVHPGWSAGLSLRWSRWTRPMDLGFLGLLGEENRFGVVFLYCIVFVQGVYISQHISTISACFWVFGRFLGLIGIFVCFPGLCCKPDKSIRVFL